MSHARSSNMERSFSTGGVRMRLTVAAKGSIAAALFLGAALLTGGAEAAAPKYSYFVVGDPADSPATPIGGIALMGGGTDQDAAFQWMNGRSGGGYFLVTPTTGTDAYNQWVYDF